MSGHPDPEDLDLSVSEALLSDTDPSPAPEVATVLDALRSPAHGAELAPAADLVPRLAQAARDARRSGALARGTRRMVALRTRTATVRLTTRPPRTTTGQSGLVRGARAR